MTLLTLSMPWQFTAALFPVFLSLLSLIAKHVRKSVGLYYLPHNRGEHEVTATAVSWLFAAAATAVMLSPLSQRLPAFFFILFLFRLTLTDALTGLLPRHMTVSCLLAGLAASLWKPVSEGSGAALSVLAGHTAACLVVLVMVGALRQFSILRDGRENPALGDVWLAGAVTAWLGFSDGCWAIGTGVVMFTLWQAPKRHTGEGGPLGPWLSAGAVTVTLIQLYQPIVIW
ncbi:potassium transporter TrkH [Pantoea ananatis]|uniref:potassium transporter TrkH n=1 Tax=Pantoea ananas TaxID=553 RepID=UPI00158D6F86|nr:potassium transporter TrkH [Pantoea ananatis]MBA4823436.1 potassium transporter TrkH [Pantoea ananatis]QKV88056.1 potassium transporter TrkH [Pantoea ananatis]